MKEIDFQSNNREIKPTQTPVNGKLQRAIMWSQIAEILEKYEQPRPSMHLVEEINSIETIDSIQINTPRERILFVNDMNA